MNSDQTPAQSSSSTVEDYMGLTRVNFSVVSESRKKTGFELHILLNGVKLNAIIESGATAYFLSSKFCKDNDL
jgi:hypothetical protein